VERLYAPASPMLLTLTTTHRPATDLGYLLHKHPDRVQRLTLPFGHAHVLYPEAGEQRCTAALLVDVDPVGLVRRANGDTGLRQYVNDRPYAASSLLSVALITAFRTAMAGRCDARPELAASAIALRAELPAVPCRGGEALARRIFEPLGYELEYEPLPLDERFPGWGEGRHARLALEGTVRLADLLGHIYVLVPVLDDDKHYWVDRDEVDKLLRRGEGWLAAHPERTLIADRYLKHRRHLARDVLARLSEPEEDVDAEQRERAAEEDRLEAGMSLRDQRLGAVVAAVRASGARSVLDLGCGGGRLLQRLLAEPRLERVVGVDVSVRALEQAEARLRLDRLPPARRDAVSLLQGALTYRDDRLRGFDAAALVEVIEHVEPPRLGAVEEALFGVAAPGTVILTTPNAEYNVRWPTLPAGRFRHRDHRFEWTRAELAAWAEGVAGRHGYRVRFVRIGPEDPEVGAPTQMAVFSR
jgi:3' terminal RNA ribose 2'-O-methyltransferase Hen1